MTYPRPTPALRSARLLGIVGDIYRDHEHLLTVSETMWKRGVSVLLVLGDFGFVWEGESSKSTLDRISVRLGEREQVLYFVDGTHEDFGSVRGFGIAEDGSRWLRQNIAHLPRGYRTVLNSRETLAVLGSINSTHRNQRRDRYIWWLNRPSTDGRSYALGLAPANVLVGQAAPSSNPGLDDKLAENRSVRTESILAHAEAEREQSHRGFQQIRPNLYFGGRSHQDVGETVRDPSDGEHIDTLAVVLTESRDDVPGQGILNVHTKVVSVFPRGDATMRELTGVEDGRWKVLTQTSIYVFDLEVGTVCRHVGPKSSPTVNDGLRRLARIDTCQVGKLGAWSMRGGGYLDPVEYWQQSTEVRSIERLNPDES